MRGGSNERSDGPSSGSAARRPAPGFGGNCAPRRRRFRRVGAVPRHPPSRPRGSGGGTRGRSRRRRRDHRAARGGRGRHRLRWFGRFGPVGPEPVGPEPVGPDCGSNGTHCGAGRFATGARWGRSCTQHFQRPGRRIIRRSHRDGRHRGGRLACAEQSGRAEFHRAWFHRAWFQHAWFQHASRRRLRHRQRLRRHERRSGDRGPWWCAAHRRRAGRTGRVHTPRRVRLGPRSVWPGR